MLGAKMIICKPGDPEAKGLVKRFSGYLESSFHAGHTSDSLADFNVQLSKWPATKEVLRQRRAPGCRSMSAGRSRPDKAAGRPHKPSARDGRSSSERARCSRLESLGHHTGSARLRDPHTIATSILFISLLLILLLVLPTIPAAPRIAFTATATSLSLTVDVPPWPGLRWPPFL